MIIILARRLDLMLINKKKNLYSRDCAVPVDHKVKERMRKDRQILGPCQRIRRKKQAKQTKKHRTKLVEHEGTAVPIVVVDLWIVPKGKEKRL